MWILVISYLNFGRISGYMQQFGHAMPNKFLQIILPMIGVFFLCSLVPAWITYQLLQPIVRAATRLHERFDGLEGEAKKLVVEGPDNTAAGGDENVEVSRDIEQVNVRGEGDTERGNIAEVKRKLLKSITKEREQLKTWKQRHLKYFGF
uniref:Uncharacterized protein n=1 Tax=Rhizophora mucronata TaxID=61149 RepID=A0A2P2LX38_RHIMU